MRLTVFGATGQTGRVRVGYLGDGVGTQITRCDMAAFMLRQVMDHQLVLQAPVISN